MVALLLMAWFIKDMIFLLQSAPAVMRGFLVCLSRSGLVVQAMSMAWFHVCWAAFHDFLGGCFELAPRTVSPDGVPRL